MKMALKVLTPAQDFDGLKRTPDLALPTGMKTYLVIASLMILQIGCGRADRIYPGESRITVDGRGFLPRAILDQSVNQSTAAVTTDQETNVKALGLRTQAGSNTMSGFQGGGIGNRAIAGFKNFNKVRLTELSVIQISAKQTEGNAPVELSIQVDLKCDGAELKLLTAPVTGLSNTEYTVVDLSLNSGAWKIEGEVDSFRSADYPEACVTHSQIQNDALPKVPTVGILLSLGDPTTVSENQLLIQSIQIGDDQYTISDWGNL